MNEEDTLQTTETTADMPSDVSSPIGYVRATRAERIRNDSSAPDFTVPKVQGLDSIFKDAPVRLTPDEIQDIVKNSGIKEGVGTQAAVAMENALIAYNSTDEQLELIGANVENMVTGGKIGDEWRDAAFEMMRTKKELLNINEESIGGVRNWFAKLAGGGTSMLQMVVESYATGGILPILKMGIDALGEGTYNDMQKYYDEHDGSLEGYEPKGIDLAVNTMNGFAQAYIERKLGVASPRFLVGWSKGLWKEGVSGAAQEGLQAIVGDLSEVAKGNEDVALLLDNAYDYVVTASVGAVLQGPLGAATHGQARARSDRIIASAIAQAKGRTEPLKEDFAAAKRINDATERQLTSQITTEFKAAFDANSGEGKLQQNILTALNKAVQAKELDLGTDSETDLAQKLEAIATQETLNALELAIEQNKSVADMGISNIVYKDGAIYLEGETPELGERAVDRARVIAERQSGLAEAKTKLDALNQEIKETQKALDEAKAAAKEAQVKRLQARLEKQQALEAKRTQEAERLQAQTEKLQKRIEARLAGQEQAQAQETPTQEVAPTTEMPAGETATETQATVADTQALEELTRAVRDNEIALTKLERAQWEKMNEPQTAQQTPQAQQVAQAERVQFAKQMLDKYKPDWQKSAKPMAQVAQKAQPKPMAKVLEKAAKYKGEKKSLKKERMKLDANSKYVKVIEKPKDVDFSDAKEYKEAGSRYVLNNVKIKEQNGNLYFMLRGGRYAPTQYAVIENYKNTNPFEILSAQINEDKQIGDHFETAIKDFYREKGLWSLNQGMRLKSIDESIAEDKAREEQQPKAKGKPKTLAELKERLREHFRKVYEGAPEYSIERYVDEAIEDVELTRNKNTALKILAEHFDELYDPNDNTKVNWEWLQEYDGDIKGDSFTALYMYETGDFTTNEDSDADVWEVVDEFTNAMHDLPITTKQQALEWVKKHQYESTIKKLGFDETLTNEDLGFEKWQEGKTYQDNDIVILPYKGNPIGVREGDRWLVAESAPEAIRISNERKRLAEAQKEYEKKKAREKAEAQKKMEEDFLSDEGTAVIPMDYIIEKLKYYDMWDDLKLREKGNMNAIGSLVFQDGEIKRGHRNEKTKKGSKISQKTIDTVQEVRRRMKKVAQDIKAIGEANQRRANEYMEAQDAKKPHGEPMEDWTGKTPSMVADEKIKKEFDAYRAEISTYEKQGVITDVDAEEQSDDFSEIGDGVFSKELIDYMVMKYNFDPRVVDWIKENPDLMRNQEDQTDAWDATSGSKFIDVLGEQLDFAPEGLKQIDIYDQNEPPFDYETTVYKMPQTQEEFERKVAETIVKQATTALELEDSDAKTFVENDDRTPYLFQSKVEGTGSDTKRGGYDERLKRIILKDDADLTTIQHEFAHYWMQNNFKWARSGLASQDWLRRWRDVEEALGIEPQDRYLSRQASEKFARAYERYIMEGKVADDLKWAFDGFQKFYKDTYEDLENEYFDLSEELDPKIVDWFNRQRPVTEEQLKQDAYKRVAEVAMSQGAEISTPVADGISTVSSMNQKGEIETSIVVSDKAAKGATLAEYTGKTKNRRTIEGLRESNPDIESDKYKEVSNKGTVKNATRWVETDTAGAWVALNDSSENWINRSALFEAFKAYAENGHPEVGIELSKISFPKEVTELGQAISLLSERAEFDPLTILEFKEKSTGTLEESVANEEINDMAIGEEETDPTEEQIARFKKQTECKL